MTVIDFHTRQPILPPTPRQLTSDERMQCLLLAAMNDDRASLCVKGQEGLRTLFEMNAKFMRSIANDRLP